MKKIILLFPVLFLLFSCQKDDDTNTPEETKLEEVTSEVLLFEFTPDTGNNSSRLQYEIKFTNPNDVAVNGFFKITFKSNGLTTSRLSTNLSPCYSIDANSDCTISFDKEQPLEYGNHPVELVSVEYTMEDRNN